MALATVNNGVNVQALLDAREALKGAPDAAKFTCLLYTSDAADE